MATYLVPSTIYLLEGVVEQKWPEGFTPDVWNHDAMYRDFGNDPSFLVETDAEVPSIPGIFKIPDVRDRIVGGDFIRLMEWLERAPHDWTFTANSIWSNVVDELHQVASLKQRLSNPEQLDIPVTLSLPATDNFNRADGPLGSNWTNISGGVVGGIISNAYRPSGAAFSYERWNADTFPNDQYSKGLVGNTAAGSGSQQYVGVTVRNASSVVTNYIFYFDLAGGYIGKNISGSFTVLQTISGVSNFNILAELDAVGTNLKAYIGGIQVGSTQPDSAIVSGYAGISGFLSGSATEIDDWEGGSLAAAVVAETVQFVVIAG